MKGSLSEILAEHKRKLLAAARESSAGAIESVENLSPVESGELRESWKPSQDPRTIMVGDTLTVVSEAFYARAVEYGHDGVPPVGMVRITAMMWQRIVDEAARKVR